MTMPVNKFHHPVCKAHDVKMNGDDDDVWEEVSVGSAKAFF